MTRKLALILPLLLLAACSSKAREVEIIHKASLDRTLIMTDNSGVRYGTVQLDAMGGGRLYDIDGRLIGTIEPNTR